MTQLKASLVGILALCGFLLVAVPGVLIVILVPGEDRRRRAAHRTARLGLAAAGLRLRVGGLDRLPEEPTVVVANHASYLDGIILTASLPPRFTFVIKREVTRVPLVARLLHRLGSEFVERFDGRESRASGRRLAALAHHGHALGFFPEGTFVREPGLRSFRKGAFHAASQAGLPVVPVVIRGSRAALPAEQWRLRPGVIEVEVLEPLAPDQGRGASRRLMEAAREAMLERLGEPDAVRPTRSARPPRS